MVPFIKRQPSVHNLTTQRLSAACWNNPYCQSSVPHDPFKRPWVNVRAHQDPNCRLRRPQISATILNHVVWILSSNLSPNCPLLLISPPNTELPLPPILTPDAYSSSYDEMITSSSHTSLLFRNLNSSSLQFRF